MNLEIKKKKDSRDYQVYLNEISVGSTEGNYGDEKEYHIDFEHIIFDLSKDYKISDFFNYGVHSFRLDFFNENFKHLDWILVDQSSIWFEHELKCTVNILPNLLEWNKPFSILTFLGKLESKLREKNVNTDFTGNLTEYGIYITFDINPNKTITGEYEQIINTLNEDVKSVFDNIYSIEIGNELLSIFSFPPEIRQACEQYLIYFSKFLEDFGIEVSSKLDAHTKDTFFTIIPKDSDEALSQIKQLLDIYLTIPEINDFEDSYSTVDIGVQQLIANVYHLKSQLFLAKSAIQLKDATIESLKLTNYQQSLLLNSGTNNNEEKTLGGLVTIDEYEGKGFKINLAEIFRRLKRKFNH